MSKGSNRRPGTGYEANFDAIFRKKEEPQLAYKRQPFDHAHWLAKQVAMADKLHTDFTQEGEDTNTGSNQPS